MSMTFEICYVALLFLNAYSHKVSFPVVAHLPSYAANKKDAFLLLKSLRAPP